MSTNTFSDWTPIFPQDEHSCPFCKETGFDRKGLANHLWSYCESYSGALAAYRDEMSARYAGRYEKREESK